MTPEERVRALAQKLMEEVDCAMAEVSRPVLMVHGAPTYLSPKLYQKLHRQGEEGELPAEDFAQLVGGFVVALRALGAKLTLIKLDVSR